MGLAEMLAGKDARPADHTGDAEHSNSRQLAEESLRAAHSAMQSGDFAAAHDHMADWVEHHKRSAYNEPSPGQKDADGDDDASAMIVLAPRKMG